MTWFLDILPTGEVVCLYTDLIPLHALGPLQVTRASTVEFDEAAQGWQVTLCDGSRLPGTFRSRAEALTAEVVHLQTHWDDMSWIPKEVPDGNDAQSL